VFGESFLQPDIAVFRQNLHALESLNSLHRLYSKVYVSLFSSSCVCRPTHYIVSTPRLTSLSSLLAVCVVQSVTVDVIREVELSWVLSVYSVSSAVCTTWLNVSRVFTDHFCFTAFWHSSYIQQQGGSKLIVSHDAMLCCQQMSVRSSVSHTDFFKVLIY